MKKRALVNIEKKNIIFEYNSKKVKALSFNPNDRTVEILYLEDNKKDKMAFIHLPKNIKRIISPL